MGSFQMAPTAQSHEQCTAPAGSGVGQNNSPKGQKQIDSPAHPIHQLQGAFDESIVEALGKTKNEWVVDLDAQSRRKDLLEKVEYERLCGRRWRQRPGERYHPFWKLIAQMLFGFHLLVKGLAKSDTEVLKILQGHIDELDGFLERTSEDFLIIQLDLRTRIQYLSLPLQNLDVFDGMLADRNFRISMINYNDLIERAIDRFSTAVKDALKDIQKGKEAIGALWYYLGQISRENFPLPGDIQAIHDAMAANAEGWNMTFSRLRKKGTALESALDQLGLAVTEMQRRVGVASRKNTASFANTSPSPPQSRSLKERLFEKSPPISVSSRPISEKPLPRDPGVTRADTAPATPRRSRSRKMAQKSVPNLRAAKTSDSYVAAASTPDRAQSSHETADSNAGPDSAVPRTPRSLSRKLSVAMLPKRSVSDDTVQTRPTAEPSKTLKTRSISLEQLKTLRGSRKMSTSETPVEIPPVPPRPSTRQETVKGQLLHHFKTDHVADAWETAGKKEKSISRRSSLKKLDGPLSIFRVKSFNALRNSERPQTASFENDLERQMAWLQQETASLNTYSFTPKRDDSPRIHVLPVHQTLTEEEEEAEEEEADDDHDASGIETTKGDDGSLLTALPSFPLPPIAEIRTTSTTSLSS